MMIETEARLKSGQRRVRHAGRRVTVRDVAASLGVARPEQGEREQDDDAQGSHCMQSRTGLMLPINLEHHEFHKVASSSLQTTILLLLLLLLLSFTPQRLAL
eukprot:762901-Hanusia_phi.AAC.2